MEKSTQKHNPAASNDTLTASCVKENKSPTDMLEEANKEQRILSEVANKSSNFDYGATKPETIPLITIPAAAERTNYVSIEESIRKHNAAASNDTLTASCVKENKNPMDILEEANKEQRILTEVVNENSNFDYGATKPEIIPLITKPAAAERTNYVSIEESTRKHNPAASNDTLTMSALCVKENKSPMDILEEANKEQRILTEVANKNSNFNCLSPTPRKKSSKPEAIPLNTKSSGPEKSSCVSMEENTRKQNAAASDESLRISDLCVKETKSSMTGAYSNLTVTTADDVKTFLNDEESNTASGSKGVFNISEVTNVEQRTSSEVFENSDFESVSSKTPEKSSTPNKILLISNLTPPDQSSCPSIEESTPVHNTAALNLHLANSDTGRALKMVQSDKRLLAHDVVQEHAEKFHSCVSMTETNTGTQEMATLASLRVGKGRQGAENIGKFEKQPASTDLNKALTHETAALDLSRKQNARNEHDIMNVNDESKNTLLRDQQRSRLVARLSDLHSTDSSDTDKFISDTAEFLRILENVFPTSHSSLKNAQFSNSIATFRKRPTSLARNKNFSRGTSAFYLSNERTIRNEHNALNMYHDKSTNPLFSNQQIPWKDSIETLQSVFPAACISVTQTHNGIGTPVLQQHYAPETVNTITKWTESENVLPVNQIRSAIPLTERSLPEDDETSDGLSVSETESFGQILKSAISVLATPDMFDSHLQSRRSVFQENDLPSGSCFNQQLSTVPSADHTFLVPYQTFPVKDIFGPIKQRSKYTVAAFENTLPIPNSSTFDIARSTADPHTEKHCAADEHIANALPSHQQPGAKFSLDAILSVKGQAPAMQELSVTGSTECATPDVDNVSTSTDSNPFDTDKKTATMESPLLEGKELCVREFARKD